MSGSVAEEASSRLPSGRPAQSGGNAPYGLAASPAPACVAGEASQGSAWLGGEASQWSDWVACEASQGSAWLAAALLRASRRRAARAATPPASAGRAAG